MGNSDLQFEPDASSPDPLPHVRHVSQMGDVKKIDELVGQKANVDWMNPRECARHCVRQPGMRELLPPLNYARL